MAGLPTAQTNLDDVDHWEQVLGNLKSAQLDDLEHLLQSQKANITKLDGSGSTAINVAVQQSNEAVLDFLLNTWNVDPNLQDAQKVTALHTAIRIHAPMHIFERIVTHSEIQLQLQNGVSQSPLEVAVIEGNVEQVQMLLQKGSSPHVHCSDKSHLLYKAVETGSLAILKLLLQYKTVNVNYDQLPELLSPLVLACLKEEELMVKELLSFETIDPNKRDSQDRPVLVLAALTRNKAIFKACRDHKRTDLKELDRFGVVLDFLQLPDRHRKRSSREAVMSIDQDFSDYPWSDKGRFPEYDESESLPGTFISRLGEGSHGVVSRYQCKRDGLMVAIKIIGGAKRSRENELKILEKIKHPHAPQLIAVFRHKRANKPPEIGVVLYPVAQCNLDEYLNSAGTGFSFFRYCQLSLWFGCAAKAVEYVHGLNIKHKDVKLQNFLIDGNRIYLADFSISKHFVDGNSQSDGPIKTTIRYRAPEDVPEISFRGRSADIFSLACCYLGMANTMIGRSSGEFKRIIGENAFHAMQDEMSDWLDGLTVDVAEGPHLQDFPCYRHGFLRIIDTIRQMMRPKPKDRPKAYMIYPAVIQASPWICPTCHPDGSRYDDPMIKFIKPTD